MALEQNVANSFRLVKHDIIHLQNAVNALTQQNQQLIAMINSLQQRRIAEPAFVRVGSKAREFVAAKNSKTYHIPECPFAKNIQPKNKVVFASKTKALNVGKKPCNCVKQV